MTFFLLLLFFFCFFFFFFFFFFANASANEKEKLTEIYETHIKNKELARKHREHDKSQVKNINSETVVCWFYLEEVLLTPDSFESCLFYKRRLNYFNFVIYDMDIVIYGMKQYPAEVHVKLLHVFFHLFRTCQERTIKDLLCI